MSAVDWDSIVEVRQKSKDFFGGDSLIPFKEFVAGLPDQLGDNMTARVTVELVINK